MRSAAARNDFTALPLPSCALIGERTVTISFSVRTASPRCDGESTSRALCRASERALRLIAWTRSPADVVLVSFDRATAGTGIGAEPAPVPGHVAAASPSASLRLQILATEHWSLLASRSLAWNESFSRAAMFLSTLSGAIVALALVAQASAFGDTFTLFALVILPVVLFIGLATFIRLGASHYHDAMCVIGMNRIRAAYLGLAP